VSSGSPTTPCPNCVRCGRRRWPRAHDRDGRGPGIHGRAIGPHRAPASVESSSHAPVIAFHGGCRISPRRRPFVVHTSNGLAAANVDSAYGRGGRDRVCGPRWEIPNALDLCDSHASLRQRPCSSSLRSAARAGGRRAYAADATGPAEQPKRDVAAYGSASARSSALGRHPVTTRAIAIAVIVIAVIVLIVLFA
jgi:hypothetical protein